MITRPLDLISKLRPEPRDFDWLFFVNVGLIGLFFSLFGSRWVLAPGLAVDFLPQIAGARAEARPATHFITVINANQIFADDGLRNMEQLRVWLTAQAKTVKQPSLLIRARSGVAMSVVTDIMSAARTAGFMVSVAAEESTVEAERGNR